jgi:CheY-like chemotaxis protein
VTLNQQTELTGLRALVVDDCYDDRELLTTMLEIHGIEVNAVASVRAALPAIHETQPDLLFCDLAMPYQDGYTLIRQVRSMEVGRSIPAIAVSALSPEEERLNSLAAGFHAYVTKPIELQTLATTIRQLLKSRLQIA